MDTLMKEFSDFLAEELQFLTNIKLFLARVPELLTSGEITQIEFQEFLEKYEIETARFLFEKNDYKDQIAEKLAISPAYFTFNLLAQLGFREFEDLSRRIFKAANEIGVQLVKVSIYLKNFTKLQQDFRRLNNFLYQKDYSLRGVDSPYSPGRNFYREA